MLQLNNLGSKLKEKLDLASESETMFKFLGQLQCTKDSDDSDNTCRHKYAI